MHQGVAGDCEPPTHSYEQSTPAAACESGECEVWRTRRLVMVPHHLQPWQPAVADAAQSDAAAVVV